MFENVLCFIYEIQFLFGMKNFIETLQFPVNKVLLLTKTNIINILCRMCLGFYSNPPGVSNDRPSIVMH